MRIYPFALKDDTDMIAGMMGMHAQFTISDATMELAAANKPDEVGYHIHVAEGIEDLHDCLKKYGKRIVDRLMDFSILGGRRCWVIVFTLTLMKWI